MLGDLLGDAFAADQPGPHDLVGVALVHAAEQDGHTALAAVAARLVDHPVRQVGGVPLGQDAAGLRLDADVPRRPHGPAGWTVSRSASRTGRVHAAAALTWDSQAG